LSPVRLASVSALVVAALVFAFPHARLRAALLAETDQADAVRMAYLQAWLRATPRDGALLGALADEYVHAGRLQEAEDTLARMPAPLPPELWRATLITRLAIESRRAEPAAKALETALLKQAKDADWSVAELRVLAAHARALDLPDLTLHFYRQLATKDVRHADTWRETTADFLSEAGDHVAAAETWFALQRQAGPVSAQRRYFIAGLSALEAGGLGNRALREAEHLAGPLLNDAPTLRFLIRLAGDAHRPDLAERYAARLGRPSA
jgi:thioredoxin-like negative regulator of GroEL